jgi:hypothetical protein
MRRLRRLIFKLTVFFAILEGLARVDFLVLLAAMGVGIAILICSDLILASPSPR